MSSAASSNPRLHRRAPGWAALADPDAPSRAAPLWLSIAGLGAGAAFAHLASLAPGVAPQLALLGGAAAAGGLGFYGVAERIASRRGATRREEDPFHLAYEGAPEPVALVDAAGRVVALNAAARAGGSATGGARGLALAALGEEGAEAERRVDALLFRLLRAGGEDRASRSDGAAAVFSAWRYDDDRMVLRWRVETGVETADRAPVERRGGRRASDRVEPGVAASADAQDRLDAMFRGVDLVSGPAPGPVVSDVPAGALSRSEAVGWLRFDLDGGVLGIDETLAAWLGTRVDAGGPRALSDVFPDAHRRLLEAARAGRGARLFRVRLASADPTGDQIAAPNAGSGLVAAFVAPESASAGVALVADPGPETIGNLATPGQGLGLTLSAERLADAFEALRGARLFEDSPIGVAALSEDGRLLRANGAAAHLLSGDAAPDALIGRPLSGWIAPEDRAAAVERIASAAQGEAVDGPSFEARLIEPAGAGAERPGEPRTAEVYLSRLETVKGPLLIAYLIDSTERRALEDRVHQSQKMQAVGQLAGGVAHDFNNLLTVIIGASEMLLQRHQANDPEFADLSVIHQNAYRAANLVRQLLAFSRKQTLRLQVANVTDRMMDLSLMLHRLLGERVRLQQQLAEDVWPVRVDIGQFEQVVTNLVVNARDAMKDGPGGRITIRSRNESLSAAGAAAYGPMPSGDYVRIEVADDGCGIPPEVQSKIFDPFFTTKGVGEGTGLGLSTVWGIVKQSGGFIFLDSAVGVGTTFTIFLPRFDPDQPEVAPAAEAPEASSAAGAAIALEGLLAPSPAATPRSAIRPLSDLSQGAAPNRIAPEGRGGAAAQGGPSPSSLRREPSSSASLADAPETTPLRTPVAPPGAPPAILLVEDEDPVRALTARALRNAGFEVFEAESGEDALELLKDPDRRVDLMVSDVVMPRMDGPTLLRTIQPSRPGLKTLFMSGYARDAFQEAFDADPPMTLDYGFLEKPFSLSDLTAAVRERLER
ncbi:MAG: ATP-binding protein [Pseudomonadota bacterium]